MDYGNNNDDYVDNDNGSNNFDNISEGYDKKMKIIMTMIMMITIDIYNEYSDGYYYIIVLMTVITIVTITMIMSYY